MKDNNIGFKTPTGLKIRLNHRYFFYQLTKADRYYTDEEIVNNDIMYNATVNIESMFLIPKMLIQVFALLTVIFKIDAVIFCITSFVLYAFGLLWRCAKQDFLLSAFLLFLASAYKRLWWLCYIALIVLIFAFDGVYLVIPYLIIRVVLFSFAMLLNHLTLTVTLKKYGVAFNDTEICAFRVFHALSGGKEKLSDYIREYISVVYEKD